MIVTLNKWPEEAFEIAEAISRWADSPTGPFYRTDEVQHDWDFDGRSLPRYMLEATQLFVALHENTDWGQTMWHEVMVEDFIPDLEAVLDECETWMNNHCSMYGSLTIYGMMAEKFPEKYRLVVERIK